MIQSLDITYNLNPIRNNMDEKIMIIYDVILVLNLYKLTSSDVSIIETKAVESLGLTWNDVFNEYPIDVKID